MTGAPPLSILLRAVAKRLEVRGRSFPDGLAAPPNSRWDARWEAGLAERVGQVWAILAKILGEAVIPAPPEPQAILALPSPSLAGEVETLLAQAELYAADASRLWARAVLLMVSGDLSALDRIAALRGEALACARAGLQQWERGVAMLTAPLVAEAGTLETPVPDSPGPDKPVPVGEQAEDATVRLADAEIPALLATPPAEAAPNHPGEIRAGLRKLIEGSFEFGEDTLILGGRYDIRDTIGRGSFGTVLEALDQRLHRLVAVKVMAVPPGSAAEQAELRARFRQEARAVGRLSHPGIVPVHDFGEEADTAWLVMDLVIGETLRDIMTSGEAIPPDKAGRIATQLLEALGFAHERGIVHRDVKPANILLTADPGSEFGQVRLVDFGVAHFGNSNVTTAGQMVGTLSTMSPEQVRGEAVDHRADLWAVGVVLYQMLTGTRPFRGNQMALINGILNEDPEPPSRRLPGLPPALDAVLAQALARSAEARFPDAAAFIAALARMEGEPGDIAPAEIRNAPEASSTEDSVYESGGVLRALRQRFSRQG